jgi:hypothetical protein
MPNNQHARSKAKPQAMPMLSQTTFNLLPMTSFHPMATSIMAMSALSANISISTSKIQPSECMYGMMYGKVGREKSLNPHCVSLIRAVAGGVMMRRRMWKECMRKLRSFERWRQLGRSRKLEGDPANIPSQRLRYQRDEPCYR